MLLNNNGAPKDHDADRRRTKQGQNGNDGDHVAVNVDEEGNEVVFNHGNVRGDATIMEEEEKEEEGEMEPEEKEAAQKLNKKKSSNNDDNEEDSDNDIEDSRDTLN